MSNSDSFIDEVTEEVQRDKLFLLMRRWGWVAILVVLLIVGGAAWNEWRKAQSAAEAQAAGDALLAALDRNDAAARLAALEDVAVAGGAEAVAALLEAGAQQEVEDIPAARATLNDLAVNPDVPQVYRDLAALKALMLPGDDLTEADRRVSLEALAQAGNPYRTLAIEQLALADVASGDSEAAIDRLRALVDDAEATQGLRDRAQGLIVALGGELDAPLAAN